MDPELKILHALYHIRRLMRVLQDVTIHSIRAFRIRSIWFQYHRKMRD
jgi:hypothetical protein